MKRKWSVFFCILLIASMFPIKAGANGGPGASIQVEVKIDGEEECWAGLFSDRETAGRSGIITGDNTGEKGEIIKKFQAIAKEKGLVYLGDLDRLEANEGTKRTVMWNYRSLSRFQMALYFPQYDSYALSEELASYAFHSDFTGELSSAQLQKIRAGQTVSELKFSKNWKYGEELAGAGIRFLFTLGVELGLALLFGYRRKRQLWFLFWVNFTTQLGLNLALFFWVYQWGSGIFALLLYLLLELLILLTESALYAVFLKRWDKGGRHGTPFAVLYATVANAASFGVGILLSKLWPQMFF